MSNIHLRPIMLNVLQYKAIWISIRDTAFIFYHEVFAPKLQNSLGCKISPLCVSEAQNFFKCNLKHLPKPFQHP